MTDEEKKAIEWLKKADWFSARLYSTTILNLIETQQKEIEELKKPKYIMNFETNEITTLTNDFISKDKIKEIIYGDYTDLGIIIEIRKLIEE